MLNGLVHRADNKNPSPPILQRVKDIIRAEWRDWVLTEAIERAIKGDSARLEDKMTRLAFLLELKIEYVLLYATVRMS